MQISLNQSKSEKKIHWRILAFLIYFVLIFILQKVLTNNLYEESKTILKNMNNNQDLSKGVITFFILFTYIGTITPYLIFLTIIYNFTNIYKSFILLMVVLNTYLFGGLIKLILAEPRPFFQDSDIINHDYSCGMGYGNPSGHAVSATAFYLTLWHIIFDSSYLKEKRLLKYFSLCLIIFILILMFFGRFISGTNTIDQVIFGTMIGLGIYLCIFHVLCVNSNDGTQFFKFMNVRNIIFFTTNFLIFLSALLVYIFVQSNHKESEWIEIIKRNPNKKCFEAADSKNVFHQEGFLMIGMFLSNFWAFVGLKLEFYYSFNSNIGNWSQYNFEKIERIDDSLLSRIGVNEMQWNHTSFRTSLIRLLMILILSGIILLPFFLVSSNQNVTIVFISKFFLPIGCVAFSMFYLFKIIVHKIKLDNPTVFNLIRN